MSARWRATWAATSAASATSPSFAASRSNRSPTDDLVTIEELEAALACAAGCRRRLSTAIASRRSMPARRDGAALECLPQVAVTDDAASRIRLGNAVIVRGRDAPVEADGGLRHRARQAGGDRRDRGRDVQAEAGLCRLTKTVSNSAEAMDSPADETRSPARRCSTKAAGPRRAPLAGRRLARHADRRPARRSSPRSA